MKISIVLEGYLKNKYSFSPIELYYSKPVTVRKALKDTKISSVDVFFIKIGDSIVKEDYLIIITKSEEIKLFPIIDRGYKKLEI